MKIEILDEAQQDLVEGFQFYESRDAGIGSYFWTVSSRTLIHCSFLLGFTKSFTDIIVLFPNVFRLRFTTTSLAS